MTALNFYPYYEQLLKRREKHATIRPGDRRSEYHVGDIITITVGWGKENEPKEIGKAQITNVQYKTMRNIAENDLEGESPDCSSKEAIPYVLSAIYQRVLTESDFVTIIHWKYLD
jgi:hypothetical protein